MFFKRYKKGGRERGRRQKGLSCVAAGEAGLNPSGY